MSTLLDRLRAALTPDYEVTRELGSGGMGVIFLGRDTRLDRPVAVKIIRPELASAHAAERFIREARVLAALNHPNVVPIHDVGERDGFFFYVMAYLEGETVADRLARSRLSVAETVRLCRDVLDALHAAHLRGVVHRDIKPSNIFLVEGRAILTDFGIAKSLSERGATPTDPDQPVGTLEYMPPEQAAAGDVTPRTDLYALAMVAYEAITGRAWSILDRPEAADWSGVPGRLARVLRKALAWHPDARWPDARAFRNALWARHPRSYLWHVAGMAAVAAIGARVLCAPLGFCATRPPYDVIVGLFRVEGAADPALGGELAFLVADILERFPRIRLVPNAVERAEDSLAGRRPSAVRVVHRVGGVVTQRGDTLGVRLELRDSLGRRSYNQHVSGSAGDKVELADNIAFLLIQRVRPELKDEYEPDATLRGRNVAALEAFLRGEEAFRQDAWGEAARYFQEALRLDTTFARAAWRLANAQRWLRVGTGIDLRRALAGKWHYLKPLDSLLIEAELAPTGPARYAIYERALARPPNDPYARLLYGAELMHRGPLAGISLDSGAAVLEEAVAQNPSLAPAHDQLIWALIRLGRRPAALVALNRLKAISRSPKGGDLDIGASLEIAFIARFAPAQFEDVVTRAAPGERRAFARTLRFGLGFDAPHAQLLLGRALAAAADQPARRAAGHEAQALALVALGRPARALTQFDSAAMLFGTPTARLEALEWRLVPVMLGMPGAPPDEAARARAALATIAGPPPVAARAAWVLAADAYARGDLPGARGHRTRLRALTGNVPALARLDTLLGALDLAARGEERESDALRASAALLPFDEWKQLGDPFARAVLHVRRAEWFTALGRATEAEAAWLWHENSDFEGWLTDEVEAAEIDWAAGVWARWRRAQAAIDRGPAPRDCDDLTRVLELWDDVEPAYAPLVLQARTLAERCRR